MDRPNAVIYKLGLKNILIYCQKNLVQYLLNLEPQITISQSKLGDGVVELTCNVCNRGQIADEYHYILECNVFELQRKKYLP